MTCFPHFSMALSKLDILWILKIISEIHLSGNIGKVESYSLLGFIYSFTHVKILRVMMLCMFPTIVNH